MEYYTCPHCGASLNIVVKWDKVSCPFCGGEIIFPAITPIDWEKLRYWRFSYQKAGKNKKKS